MDNEATTETATEEQKPLRVKRVVARYERTKKIENPRRAEAAQQRLRTDVLTAIASGSVKQPKRMAMAALGQELPPREAKEAESAS